MEGNLSTMARYRGAEAEQLRAALEQAGEGCAEAPAPAQALKKTLHDFALPS